MNIVLLVCKHGHNIIRISRLVIGNNSLNQSLNLGIVSPANQNIRVERERLGQLMQIAACSGQAKLVNKPFVVLNLFQVSENIAIDRDQIVNGLIVHANQNAQAVHNISILVNVLLLPRGRHRHIPLLELFIVANKYS